MKYCKNCLMPSTRPRITFNEKGICNACEWAEEKVSLNWEERKNELKRYCDKVSKKGKNYDVLIPVSGGKDSCYVSWKMKHEFGMNPLLVHIEPPMPRVDGNKNLENLINSGFDCIKHAPNPVISKEIAFGELRDFGDPLMSWMIAVRAVVFQTAIRYGIKMIMWGEDGEVEYGGLTTSKFSGEHSLEYEKKILLSGNNVDKYRGIYSDAELMSWTIPDEESFNSNGIFNLHYNYFDSWNPYTNFELAKEKCGFEESEDRNAGTYTNFAQTDSYMFDLHCYLMYLKFGFGRCTADSCIDIRRNALSRQQAIKLVSRFDDLSKDLDLNLYAEYFEKNIEDVREAIYNHVNTQLFEYTKTELARKFVIGTGL